ncbi:MAG: D-cysteine desulfhydrase family protein [Candidatus Omnitrophota bacterium]
MPQSPLRISLAQIPTPIEPLPKLSREFGADLRVKRDDLTGSALSGNKVRKLEYLLADALNKGCDSIITCGAVASNHARAAVIAARKIGLDSLLILAGDEPKAAEGNLQLDLLAGAQVRYISKEEYSNRIDNILQQAADQWKAEGRNPYVIPTGGSNSVGLMGYVQAAAEIDEQCAEQQWNPDFLVCAVGSGGTYAGLLLGTLLRRIQTKVLGILVCGTVEHFREKVLRDIRGSIEKYQLETNVDESSIHLVDGYIGGGYAVTNSQQLRLIRHIAQQEALILDPVYTGKAFCGLLGEIEKGDIPQGAKVLFIHTGGVFGLSAYSETMTKEWGSLAVWPDSL